MAGLIPLADDLWHLEVHRHRMGLHFRNRMVVARLSDGGLWLHAPVPLSEAVVAELAALGPVAHLVAPNLSHHLWMAAAAARFPHARVWGPPGMAEKKPEVGFDAVLGVTPDPWSDVLDTLPLGGTPAMNEVVFLHRASGTLVCTDLVIHVPDEPSWATRLLYRAIGVGVRPATASLFQRRTLDRAAARRSVDQLLAWPVRRVVMAHGDVIEQDAHARLRAALAWV